MLLDTLEEDMQRLRARWPKDWPGMPWVLDSCLRSLDHPESLAPLSASTAVAERYRVLRDGAGALAGALEDWHAKRAAEGREAPYHNRLHFADCMLALCTLLRAARSHTASADAALQAQQMDAPALHAQEMLLLLIVLAHDLQHDGRVNSAPMEMESLSATAAVSLLRNLGLSGQDLAILEQTIRHTDPAVVPANHRAVAGRRFSLEDPQWLQVLANEADILASTLPGLGTSLAQELAREWSVAHPAMAQRVVSDAGRLFFLEHVALFSSPASHLLGLDGIRQQQIDALRARLHAP